MTGDPLADRVVSLSDYLGKKNVLLLFYPMDWSPVCSSEHTKCAAMFPTYSKRVQVLGISVDSIWSHRAFARAHGITYPLLADFQPRGDVSRKYDVFLEDFGFAARTAFLIDLTGQIRLVQRAAVPDERDIDAILKTVQP